MVSIVQLFAHFLLTEKIVSLFVTAVQTGVTTGRDVKTKMVRFELVKSQHSLHFYRF